LFKNIVWDIIGKFGGQIVSFIISIILTRLLTPEEYGIMGMAVVIIGFANVFLDLGFRNALVQKQNITQVQYSSVFYTNALISVLLTLLCFFSAKPLAGFYNLPKIEPVFQVLSLNFLFNGLSLVSSAILYKKLIFKVNTIINLFAAVVSGIVGVYLAYNGLGVWSLVFQSVLNAFIVLVATFFYVNWWPSLQFSFLELKPLWSYGSRLFAASLLEVIFTRIDVFIIGKIFSPTMLGFYGRAQGMDNLVRQFSASSLIGTLFPYIAKNQDNRPALREIYLRFLHLIMLVSIGLSGGLYLVAIPLFNILFTKRWEYSAELFQILAVGSFAWPISSLMCSIISGVGNSKAFLRVEIYKKLVFLPLYALGFWLGLKPFIWALMIGYYVSVLLNAIYVNREIAVPLSTQFSIISKYIACGAVAVFVTILAQQVLKTSNDYALLAINGLIFSAVYFACVFTSKLEGIEIFTIVSKKLKII
jgi:teichuronic acid exporter